LPFGVRWGIHNLTGTGRSPLSASKTKDQGRVLEVSHRSKCRLYGLSALMPLRGGVAPSRRPEVGRG